MCPFQLALAIIMAATAVCVDGFVVVPNPSSTSTIRPPMISLRHTAADATSIDETTTATSNNSINRLQLTLEKPLGMILEEVQEGQAQGVYVLELAEEGSAAGNDQLIGLTLATVNGQDVTNLNFDAVMERLVEAPSPVALEFLTQEPNDNEEPDSYAVGTTVTIKVLEDDGSETLVEAKVGDNLRKILLDNNIKVYKGLKQTLGNCGGAGQCTFCAAEFVESDGWAERSEYEDQKLKKAPNSRLTCLNNIQGPATIRL
ncbi:ferredoxin [Nitzschia inconspicua]|uniref:Ferredoxin n=1 Tax=Nitzschia inconspicua TaxID=303405 RepID=A0A9K3PKP4_9STRA|nr:ferredoxin [Nitzschia inconspicua]